MRGAWEEALEQAQRLMQVQRDVRFVLAEGPKKLEALIEEIALERGMNENVVTDILLGMIRSQQIRWRDDSHLVEVA